jgi:signal transduction histidine kinase
MRAPLRAILGFTQLLRRESEGQLSEQGKQYFEQITDSARRMDRLIKDVLNLSRISRTQLRLEPVDVDCVLHGILNSYPAFQQKAEIQVQGLLPIVRANEAALTQCISNLLSNAVKFVSPDRPPRVEIWAEQKDGKVRLWFADNGIGIAPDQQERIFEIFQRVETGYEGTGIGLAIVRKAMHQMGGNVGLESEVGKGSRFWLEFPQPTGEREGTQL